MVNWTIIDLLFGCLLIGVFIEFVFRTIGRFPAYTREVFRWVYVALLSGVIISFVIFKYGHYGEMLRYTIENEQWQLLFIGLIFTGFVLINVKRKKQVE